MKSGIEHIVATVPVPKSEFEDEQFHNLTHGNAFPASPIERQLFYRDDEHKWYQYNGTAWKDLTVAAVAKLDDIGDVNVPAPAGGDFLEWDATTSKWIKIAHKDAPTGVHGALSGEELLVYHVRRGNFIMIPTGTGWTTDNAGSGTFAQEAMRSLAGTGVTANSRGCATATTYGFNEGGNYGYFNYDKKLYLIFNYARNASDAEAVARVQIKQNAGWGDALSAKGLGLRADNLALIGESYGTELGEVDLGVTLVTLITHQIMIVLDPGSSIKWYVDGVLKGTQSTAAKIPSGLLEGPYLLHGIKNGATGGVLAYSVFMHSKIWQER